MRKNISKLTFLPLLAAFFCFSVQCQACGPFKFEQKKVIPLQDFGRLADHKIASGDAGTISFWYFDEEDRPQKPGLYAVGMVLTRTGDLRETPVGGYIWASKLVGSVSYKSIQGKNGDVTADIAESNNQSECSVKALHMTLKQGGRFFINGVQVGTVK